MLQTIDMKAIELSFLEGDVVHAHFKNDILGAKVS